MPRKTMASVLAVAGLLAVVALGKPPDTGGDPRQTATKQPAPGPDGAKKADSADAAVKAALANDPDVQVARAKMLLAEAELAKAKQGVVLKVMTLQATIKEHRIAITAAEERLAWSARLVQEGKAPQSSMLDERAKVEAAKAALMRADTELKLLTGGGKEMGMEADSDATGVAIQHGTLWLSRQALLDPKQVADSSSNTLAMQSLAALYLAGAKTPVGAVPDRIRSALDKVVLLEAKGQSVTFQHALKIFKRDAGLDLTVRYGGRAGVLGPIVSDGEELPIGAWLQVFQDASSGSVLFVRDYGLLCTTKDSAPPDAPTITEFWKQKPLAQGPKEVLDPNKKPEK